MTLSHPFKIEIRWAFLFACFFFSAVSIGRADLIGVVESEQPKNNSVDHELARKRKLLDILAGGGIEKVRLEIDTQLVTDKDRFHREIELAQLFFDIGQLERGLRVLEELAKESPTFEVHMAFTQVAVQQQRWFDALTHANIASELETPNRWSDAFAHAQRLRLNETMLAIHEGMKDWEAVATLADELIKSEELIVARRFAAKARFHLGDARSALVHLTEYCAGNDDSHESPAWLLGELYSSIQSTEEADKCFKNAADKGSLKVKIRYVSWLIEQNRSLEASERLDALQTPLSLEQVVEGRNAGILFLRGLVCRQRGDLVNAIEWLSKTHQRQPENYAAASHLALVLVDTTGENSRARALQLGEALVRNQPRIGDAWATLAWIQFRCGDLASAQQSLSNGLQLGLSQRDSIHYCSKIARALGENDVAQQLENMGKNAQGPTFIKQMDS